MLYKFIPFLLIVLLIASCAGSPSVVEGASDSQNESEPSPESMIHYTQKHITFSEAVELSTCAAVAEFVSVEEKPAYTEYVFIVKEVLRGEIPDKIIHVISDRSITSIVETGYTYESGKDVYTAGCDYILIMEVYDSLFLEYPHYLFLTDIYIPTDDIGRGTMYGELISNSYNGDIVQHIREAKMAGEAISSRYTKSEDMAVIVEEADFVLEIKVIDLLAEGLHNGSPYICDILDVIKGESVTKSEEGTVYITLMKGSVKIGETYIVAVNRSGETSVIYTQSSLKSVIPSYDLSAVNEIKRLLDRN